ncbi:MAG: proton-conducting transporter membrane subunit [Bacteroidota bacterium]|nr:proton-conducting transporter membrane subunit [Bacteroidota bacterium]
MVTPIYIVAIALGIAFSLGFFGKKSAGIATGLFYAALAAIGLISAQWLIGFIFNGQSSTEVFTAGLKPPFSISLQMGLPEAVITTMINLVGFLGAVYFADQLKKYGIHLMITYLLLIMGLNVIVMTRDIFNLFVFLEISSIAMAGMALVTQEKKAVQAGFKYLIATAIISAFLLLGIILTYSYGDSLYINDLLAANLTGIKAGATAIFLILMPVILELKPFPANGWGLDMYQATHPVVGSLLSAASATASIFVLYKLAPLGGETGMQIIAVLGGITFIASNLMGLKQSHAGRILGYSSIGQMGLLVTIIGLSPYLGNKLTFIAFSILISHYLAKAGLFWILGIVKEKNINNWSNLRKKPILMVLFGTFIFALLGFPPFPGFFGKWELIMQLATAEKYAWMTLILAGSFIEGIYLLRWFSNALKLDNVELPNFKISLNKIIPITIFGLALYAFGYLVGTFTEAANAINYIPLLFIVLIATLEFLPAWAKNTISIAGVITYILFLYPSVEGDLLRQVFLGIFLGGAVITLFSGYYYKKGRRLGFYPMALSMFAGLAMLITATNLFEILYGWEIMTIGSYFLLIRGKKSRPHGYSYLMFSLGGSYTMMFGFALAFASFGNIDLQALTGITVLPTLAYSLILLGFLTKTASFGVHIWLPGAHGEAVADIHFMASAILLKAGVFGIILVLLGMGAEATYAKNVLFALGWIGALSALIGNIAASFQESAKRLLAWSSIGQLGYIVFGLAMMSHLGWTAGLFYTITHFLYKGVLFLVIGGIALKLGTPMMHKMGGLIKRMPFSFIAVLIAIITLAGIPPLVGFAGKWLFYDAIITGGFYFQGIVVLFSGVVAFLYLFKLIYSIFLGQLKDEHRNVKEISIWLLIPVYLLLFAIMIISAKPEFILKPLGNYLMAYFPNGALTWEGTMATSTLGYWDGYWTMIIIVVMFVILTGWLIITSRKAKKVKQFNIVYAGEAPERPETTHLAHNMFAGYNKVIGILIAPGVTTIWKTVNAYFHDLGDWLRGIYSGNAQSYLIHIVAYTVIVFMFINFVL